MPLSSRVYADRINNAIPLWYGSAGAHRRDACALISAESGKQGSGIRRKAKEIRGARNELNEQSGRGIIFAPLAFATRHRNLANIVFAYTEEQASRVSGRFAKRWIDDPLGSLDGHQPVLFASTQLDHAPRAFNGNYDAPRSQDCHATAKSVP